ncbi:MAG: hypothetical protein I3J02_07605 [Prevotella sp.]|nr:hypothetical protein [Prevotella sp.]
MKQRGITHGTTATPYTDCETQRREIEDLLVRIFSQIIYLDTADAEYPQWTDSTLQLMELAWTLWKTKRIIDLDTVRPMSLQRIAERLCTNLHRKVPCNVSCAVRQSKLTGRLPVMQFYGKLWFEGGISPATAIQWSPQTVFPKIKSYKGVF